MIQIFQIVNKGSLELIPVSNEISKKKKNCVSKRFSGISNFKKYKNIGEAIKALKILREKNFLSI